MWLLLALLAFAEGLEPRLSVRDQALQQQGLPAVFRLLPPDTGGHGMLALTLHRDTTLWTTSVLRLSCGRGPWLWTWEPMLKTGNDGRYPRQWFHDAFRSDFRRALILWRPAKAFRLWAGRAPVHLGESARFPLLFSEEAVPMELVAWQARWGPVAFTHLLSQWPDIQARRTTFPGDTTPEQQAHRFLSYHGLTLTIGSRGRVGFSEAFLYGGDMGFQLLYANPFTLYYTNQFNHYPMADGNILWLFHGRWLLPGHTQIYGEFLVDDFQYAPDVYHEPNHLAGLIGLEGARGSWAWHLEYAKLSAWVYNHFYAYDRFEIYGIPTGYPFGPDLETAWLRIQHRSPRLALALDLVWRVQGENRVTTPWPVPEDGPADTTYRFPQDNFLRGTVYQTWEIGVPWSWQPTESLWILGRAGWLLWKQGNRSEQSPVGEIQIRWRLPLP